MPIPHEEHAKIFNDFGVADLMDLRESTWAELDLMQNHIAKLEKLARDIFLKKVLKAKEEKTVCYYRNAAYCMCRGIINEWNIVDGKFQVRITDLDSPNSNFNKDFITFFHVYQIGQDKEPQ